MQKIYKKQRLTADFIFGNIWHFWPHIAIYGAIGRFLAGQKWGIFGGFLG